MLKSLVFTTIMVLFAFPAKGDNFRNVTVVSVLNGQSFLVRLPGISNYYDAVVVVQIRGLETPALPGRCPQERELALEAMSYLGELLFEAQHIDLIDVQRGTYFRIFATVRVDEQDLSFLMIKNRFGLPAKFQTRNKDGGWCHSQEGE